MEDRLNSRTEPKTPLSKLDELADSLKESDGLLKDSKGNEYCGRCGSYEVERCGAVYRCYGCDNKKGD